MFFFISGTRMMLSSNLPFGKGPTPLVGKDCNDLAQRLFRKGMLTRRARSIL